MTKTIKCYVCLKEMNIYKSNWKIGFRISINPVKFYFIVLCIECKEKEKEQFKELKIE